MKVGLTYDLRADYLAEGYGEEETAEFDRPDTIDAIEDALRELGHETVRIGNLRALAARLVAGERWDLVFNVAEGLRGVAREAEVPALLEAYDVPCTFSDPMVLALTLHKGMTKRVVRDLGIPTAPFAVVEDEAGLDLVDLPFPLFVKPLAEGTGKGIDASSKVRDRAGLVETGLRLLARHRQPVLVETFLPGREFTVGVVGTGRDARALGALEVRLRPGAEENAYSYINKERCEELIDYVLVEDDEARSACELGLAAWRGLGCRDGGRVDLKSDRHGVPNFIEVNPLAGMHPAHSDLPILCAQLGIPYLELIRAIVDSARARLRGPGT
jgi:D-alanine-D-alanine ligase